MTSPHPCLSPHPRLSNHRFQLYGSPSCSFLKESPEPSLDETVHDWTTNGGTFRQIDGNQLQREGNVAGIEVKHETDHGVRNPRHHVHKTGK